MRRDNLSAAEAHACVDEVMETIEILLRQGRFDEVESYFESELGLEPDYLIDLLWDKGV